MSVLLLQHGVRPPDDITAATADDASKELPNLGTPVVFVSEAGVVDDASVTQSADTSDLPWISGAGDACYVLYTSGSTGKPKGILVEHRNVMQYVHATMQGERIQPTGPACRTLFVSSLVFDSHVFDVYPTFACGGTLVAYPKVHRLEGLMKSWHKTVSPRLDRARVSCL